MHFTFQESYIWEGSNNLPDPAGKKIRVKNRSEERARRKLPRPGLGRHWVLVAERTK